MRCRPGRTDHNFNEMVVTSVAPSIDIDLLIIDRYFYVIGHVYLFRRNGVRAEQSGLRFRIGNARLLQTIARLKEFQRIFRQPPNMPSGTS